MFIQKKIIGKNITDDICFNNKTDKYKTPVVVELFAK